MRTSTPPLIRILEAVPRVSTVEGFHCSCNIILIKLHFFLAAITIGFSDPPYSVNECDGQVSIVVVLKGSPKRKVAVCLSTRDLTANGKLLIFVEV